MEKDTTHIRITKDTWRTLNALKYHGETFDDVIHRVLHQVQRVAENQTEYTKD